MLFYEALDKNIIEVRLDGEADEPQMAALREECRRIARESGGVVKVLFVLGGLGAVSPGAAKTGIGLDFDLFREMEKIAIVSDINWYRTLAGAVTRPFSFETRSFDLRERDEALAWLRN